MKTDAVVCERESNSDQSEERDLMNIRLGSKEIEIVKFTHARVQVTGTS